MRKIFTQYCRDTSGAVTVDWVVLTAAVVGLGIASAVGIANGTTSIGDNVGIFLETERPFIQNE